MDSVDALLTPSAPGEAPLGLDWTGDPVFNYIWTALYMPSITLPAGTGRMACRSACNSSGGGMRTNAC